LWAKTVETCRSARRDAGARAADIAAIGMASTIDRNAEQRQQLSALGLRLVRLHGGEKIGGLEADAPRLRLPEDNRRKRHVLPTLQRCDALAQRLARPILV
jgi:hypothetical protein